MESDSCRRLPPPPLHTKVRWHMHTLLSAITSNCIPFFSAGCLPHFISSSFQVCSVSCFPNATSQCLHKVLIISWGILVDINKRVYNSSAKNVVCQTQVTSKEACHHQWLRSLSQSLWLGHECVCNNELGLRLALHVCAGLNLIISYKPYTPKHKLH